MSSKVKCGRLGLDFASLELRLDFASSKVKRGWLELDFVSLELRTRLRVAQGLRLRVDPSTGYSVSLISQVYRFTLLTLISNSDLRFLCFILRRTNLRRSRCRHWTNFFFLLVEIRIVCSPFYSVALFLIDYSTPRSVWWKGCGNYQRICLYNPQPRSNFPAPPAEERSFPPCRFSLWSRWSYALATTLGERVLLLGCHSKKAWQFRESSFPHMVEPNSRWFQIFSRDPCRWIRRAVEDQVFII